MSLKIRRDFYDDTDPNDRSVGWRLIHETTHSPWGDAVFEMTHRMKVPGGWLYRHAMAIGEFPGTRLPAVMSTVFVPTADE